MSRPFDDYAAGPSYSDSPRASWHSHQNMPYDPAPYDIYSSGATVSESTSTTSMFPDSAPFSPSDYADSPFSFDEFESTTPLSPSSSASSSSSSCSDAPITPYYQAPDGLPLPQVGLLYTALDATVEGEYCGSSLAEPAYGSEYEYEGWEEEDTTQTYRSVALPESSMRSSTYDNPDALWACESAIAQLQYFDASPTSGFAPEPLTYATYTSSDFPAVTSSAVSPPHAQQYPFLYPPVSCLSPAALSCAPPLKLHQPQPRRSIPVVSLSALATGSESTPKTSSHFDRPTSPALSPLTLQFPSSQAQGVGMTSYSALLSSADKPPMLVYPPQCSCPECYLIS
ncbi:hypothetical protein DFH09DRAFT_562995 [Mycena vulgaris]|nr:hypothetical protein DFH09DRAFT_562995 [Mycena vulgaris]